MKIMSFNVLEGGIDEEGSRIEYIKEVIKEVSPDFLALQETNKFDEDNNTLLEEVSGDIGLPHYALSPPGLPHKNGKQYHVVSLSRYPLKNIHMFPDQPFQNGALLTLVDSPLGELAVCNVHLDAYSEDKRLKELKSILQYVSKHTNQILLGDFNSISSDDNYDIETLEVEARFDVIEILKRNYVDIAFHLELDDRTTHPAPPNTDPDFTKPIRIDYIFVSPSLAPRIKDAAVIKTSTSERASDHYPIVVNFRK